jgi:hypothetical protein
MQAIGDTLREARMRQKIDIADVEAATKIRAKYLRALENEEFGLLPGPTFVRTFLRSDGSLIPAVKISPRCRGFLAELGIGPAIFPGMEPWKYKLDNEGHAIKELPEEKNNHACSAFAYGIVDAYGYVEKLRTAKATSWSGERGPSWLEWGDQADIDAKIKTSFGGW